MIYTSNIIYILDLVGTASFAFSGALRVFHKKPDIVGMTVLAGATAIGACLASAGPALTGRNEVSLASLTRAFLKF